MDFNFIKRQVAKIVGEKYVSDDPKDLTVYSRDYSSMRSLASCCSCC